MVDKSLSLIKNFNYNTNAAPKGRRSPGVQDSIGMRIIFFLSSRQFKNLKSGQKTGPKPVKASAQGKGALL